MTRLRRLMEARQHLRERQEELHTIRRRPRYYPSFFLKAATEDLYLALDQLWDAQLANSKPRTHFSRPS
jgi:hypothetical protein